MCHIIFLFLTKTGLFLALLAAVPQTSHVASVLYNDACNSPPSTQSFNVHGINFQSSVCPIVACVEIPFAKTGEKEHKLEEWQWHVAREHLNKSEAAIYSVDSSPSTLRFPSVAWILKCSHVTVRIGNVLRVMPLSIAEKQHSALEDELFFVGSPAFPHAFQHDILNGFGYLGIAWNWLTSSSATASIRLLGSSFALSLLRENEQLAGRLAPAFAFEQLSIRKARALYIVSPRPQKAPHESTWDAYAPLSFLHFMPDIRRSLKLPRQKRTFLYLPRYPPLQRSLRVVRCGNAVAACSVVNHTSVEHALATIVTSAGFEFKVFQRNSMEDDRRTFSEAAIVFGPHGGAFTNILWMQQRGIVAEINIADRFCFASLAISSNLRYVRLEPMKWMGYHMPVGMEVSLEQMEEFVKYLLSLL